MEPETQLFEDPHLSQFLRIAPNSTRLFRRHQLLPTARMRDLYRAMGKVLVRDSELEVQACSGAMVGMDLLLTTVECIQNRTAVWTLEFVPGLDAEELEHARPWGSAFAKRCLSTEKLRAAYAVCQLDRHIGEATGYLGWRASPNHGFYLGGEWFSVGYPRNFKSGNSPVLESGIKIHTVEENAGESGEAKLLLSEPYVEMGWSGGPLVGQDGDDFYIVGAAAAVADESVYGHIFAASSLHVGGIRIGELVEYARKEWSAEK
jgi:hypothetical protein